MLKIIENRLIETFKDRESFTREELYSFFCTYEPDLKDGTFGWRIYDLKNKYIIKPVGRSKYTILHKPKFHPTLSNELIKFSKRIHDKFPDAIYCIWETDWINEFAQHQSNKRTLIIEIEKDLIESLYYYLKDSFKYDIYLDPDAKIIEHYVSSSNYPVVIKKIVTRSPIETRKENKLKISTPLLEKILVDLFTEKVLFYIYQGSELVTISQNAINNYTINMEKLLSYANRRGQKNDIKQFLEIIFEVG